MLQLRNPRSWCHWFQTARLCGWVIPFFNLFKPYQVVNEIYKAGDSTYVASDGWKRVDGSGLLLSWWIFWAITHLLGWIASKQLLKMSLRADMTHEQAITYIEFHAGFCVVAIVIAGFWFIVANALTGRLLGCAVVAISTESPMQMADATQRSTSFSRLSPDTGMCAGPAPPTKIDSVKVITQQAAPQINATADLQRVNTAASTEEDHWATAMTELESGQRRPGVWAKAYAEADGDETKATVAYLKARVHQLVAAEIARQAEDQFHKQQVIANQQADLQERQNPIEQARLAETDKLTQMPNWQ